jgi:S1-C subfamily serine protease
MRAVITAGLAAILILPAQPLEAQALDERAQAEFQKIEGSIVRIRTISDLDYTAGNEASPRAATNPHTVDGTGVVVGRMFVDGFLEYLILTNHHVAVASNYILEEDGYHRVNTTNTLAFPSVPEETYLLEEASEALSPTDIRLDALVLEVRGDMTLLRTVGANRDLTVFEGPIGYRDGEVSVGDVVLAGGYPYGKQRVVGLGRIVEMNHLHELGLPHEDMIISVPVHPGQSGGPVFQVRSDPQTGSVEFRLVGLIHARDWQRSYAVPYRLWEGHLDAFPAALQDRLIR